MRIAVGLVVAALALPVGASAKEGSRFREGVRSPGGVVASESLTAAKAGLAALDAGGNAVDAAVTTVFAVGVTRPELCGIGGGGFMVARMADGSVDAIDFREKAPANFTFTSGVGVGDASVFGTGHNVAGVPGTVAGMAMALQRRGSFPLAAAIEPARRLAAEGVPVAGALAEDYLLGAPRLRLYEESSRVYLKGGVLPYNAGETLVQPDYAASLALIQRDGAKAFYEGPIAQAIVKAMEASGRYPGDKGTMTLDDLRGYQAVARQPLAGTYRGTSVFAMPPPTSGGLLTLETLNVLEGFDLKAAGQSSADQAHLAAEALKIAWADRNAYVGDPGFTEVPIARMISKEYAASRRAEIDMASAKTYEPGAGAAAAFESSAADRGGHTTHVSVIDAAGNAAAVTCTIEQLWGSAVVAPGTGFLLNNQLTDFDNVEGHPNRPQPGKRPRSSTSPTVVVRGGQPLLVAGGSGGPEIPMGVISTVLGVVDFGLDVARAVDAERTQSRGGCGSGLVLCLEAPRFSQEVRDALRARGHEITERGEYDHSRVQAVGTDAAGARLATADPRNGSGTEEYGALGQARGAPPAVRPRAAPLRITVQPRRVRAGRRVRLRVRVLAGRAPVPRALVRIGGRSARTDSTGRATLRVRLRRGRNRGVVRTPGRRPARFTVVAR